MDELTGVQALPLKFCDYLITGRFVEELKDISLKWRGSSNQIIWQKMPTGVFVDVTEAMEA